jgi:hypothetical protein
VVTEQLEQFMFPWGDWAMDGLLSNVGFTLKICRVSTPTLTRNRDSLLIPQIEASLPMSCAPVIISRFIGHVQESYWMLPDIQYSKQILTASESSVVVRSAKGRVAAARFVRRDDCVMLHDCWTSLPTGRRVFRDLVHQQ